MNTTASQIPTEPPERGDAAAEYVLGVLDASARRAAENRLQREPVFAREVAEWENRLQPLIDEIVPVPAPYSVWPRVQAAVGLAPAAAANTRVESTSLWQSTPFWRWLSAGALSAVAASLVALLLVPRALPPPPPVPQSPALVARMTQDDGKPLFFATVDARLGTMVVQASTVDIPAGRVPELWLIPPGDKPHSLGLLDPSKANAVVVPQALLAALGPHAVVAVTIEPPGGGPGGAPSGPIIAKGEISLL